jgi:hypothetical protein
MPNYQEVTVNYDGRQIRATFELRWSRLSEQISASISGASAGLGCHADGQRGVVGLIRRHAVKA